MFTDHDGTFLTGKVISSAQYLGCHEFDEYLRIFHFIFLEDVGHSIFG